MTVSCAYEGWVRHRRHEPRHELRMGLFMLFLDLDELPELFDGYGLASARGRALVEFRRSDHLGDPDRPLAQEIRTLVASRTGGTPAGPVRLLTTPRTLGHSFNPVSVYYCLERPGGATQALVAEVTNTPWGERHAYVLAPDPDRTPGSVMRGRREKTFHVSPFMGMDHLYAWRATEPAEQLIVHIDSEREGRVVFDATLSLRRRTLTPHALRGLLVRHPLQSVRTVGRIYLEGARVWRKGAGYFPNPTGAPLLGRARREHRRTSRERAAD